MLVYLNIKLSGLGAGDLRNAYVYVLQLTIKQITYSTENIFKTNVSSAWGLEKPLECVGSRCPRQD